MDKSDTWLSALSSEDAANVERCGGDNDGNRQYKWSPTGCMSRYMSDAQQLQRWVDNVRNTVPVVVGAPPPPVEVGVWGLVPAVDGHALHRALGKMGDPSIWLRARLKKTECVAGSDYVVVKYKRGRVHGCTFHLTLRAAWLLSSKAHGGGNSPVTLYLESEMDNRRCRDVRFNQPPAARPSGPCPKCGASSGNDWSQCEGACPMPQSPHYRPDEPAKSKCTHEDGEDAWGVGNCPWCKEDRAFIERVNQLVTSEPALSGCQFGGQENNRAIAVHDAARIKAMLEDGEPMLEDGEVLDLVDYDEPTNRSRYYYYYRRGLADPVLSPWLHDFADLEAWVRGMRASIVTPPATPEIRGKSCDSLIVDDAGPFTPVDNPETTERKAVGSQQFLNFDPGHPAGDRGSTYRVFASGEGGKSIVAEQATTEDPERIGFEVVPRDKNTPQLEVDVPVIISEPVVEVCESSFSDLACIPKVQFDARPPADPATKAPAQWLDITLATPEAAPASDVCLDADTGALIPRDLYGFVIHQRATDGYVNATAMCKAAGKMIGHWSQNAETKKVLASLARIIGIPIIELVVSKVGGNIPEEQRGTWVHPKVAIHLATWCSPDFFARVIEWVHDWVVEGKVAAPAFRLPQTFAEALRQLADSTEANEQLKLENAKVTEELELETTVRQVAEKRVEEVKVEVEELLAAVDRPRKAISLWNFFKVTRNVLGMSRTIGYKICYDQGIVNKPKKDQWGVEEALPDEKWSGKGYFSIRSSEEFPMPVVNPETGEKTGEVHMVQRRTTMLTADRRDADGNVTKIGGFSWLLNELYHDPRCLLYRLAQQTGGKDGQFRPLYGCIPTLCKDAELASNAKLHHSVIRIYRPVKSRKETQWRVARQIGPDQYVTSGATLEEALTRLNAAMPKDAPKALSNAKDDD